MATTSFTLRKTAVGAGSYLQNNGDDSALRADQYVSLTAPVGQENTFSVGQVNTFSANIIKVDEVLLSWELSFSLSASAASPEPIAIEIVSSPTGEPVTVKDGDLVTRIKDNNSTNYKDNVRVSPGRWVYYSMFVQYSDFGTPTPITWYEKVASLYIQIPKQLNSVENLWNRVPEYYRNLDAQQDGNPLYNFLELFGWEMDRTRTLIDTIALSNDPELAVTPALQELAYETGLEFDPSILGTTKARAVLQNIGYLRRRKGTNESITTYLSGITGAQVDYLQNGVSHEFRIYTQRINFISDPTFTQAFSSTETANSPYKWSRQKASTYGVYTWAPSSANAASVVALGTSLSISVPSGGSDNTFVYVYTRKKMPRYDSYYYYSLFEPTYGGGASFHDFKFATGSIVSSVLVPEFDTASSGASFSFSQTKEAALLPSSTYYPEYTRVQTEPVNAGGTTTNSLFPYLVFVIPPGGSVRLTEWLVEPHSLGEYFDGNSREGGLIPGTSGYGTGSSDYRWASTTNASYSYYTLDYKRVNSIAENIVKNYLAPVTIKDNIVLVWDYYTGKT